MLSTIKIAFPYFIVPFILSMTLVPLCKQIGLNLKIYAVENNRTVHSGKIVRIGGLAIYLAFMISMAIFIDADAKWNSILLGGSIVFFVGLIDDIVDVSPKVKLLAQAIAAIVVIVMGDISLNIITFPFGLTFNTTYISLIISFGWMVGVSNAINLVDGLDGLAGGICFIVVCTIGIIGFLDGRMDVFRITLIIAGAILGFLPFNFNPASIFMGDCGALYLGFVIAAISLLGFKTTAFISLAMPIIILFIPISDTLIAIVRRKLSHKRFSEADRSHLHHVLMYKVNLGHRNTVLVLYVVALLFSGCAIVSYFDRQCGLLILLILLFAFEIFIEVTEMVNPKFHPLIGLCRRLTGYPKKKTNKN